MKSITLVEKLNHWIATSVSVKLCSIGILILILLIPMAMIQSLIEEREEIHDFAIKEVQQKWGNPQTISGPVLTIPYKTYYNKIDKNGDEIRYEKTEYAHFLPESLAVSGSINPEKRHRGIYEIVVYDSQLSLSGRFKTPDLATLKIDSKDILWEQAFVSIGIPDLRGIKSTIEVVWNEEGHVVEPGTKLNKLLPSGVNTPVLVNQEIAEYKFNALIELKGSRSLNVVPVAKETQVELSSAWDSPSFEGAFLPNSHDVSDKGFSANWKVLHLNRNFPQQWTGEDIDLQSAAFGVNLLLPVDHYQKSMRSAKYATMFIGLTFLIFFFVEVINKKRIHPFQYILVGLALCVFYALLVALSEHISFNSAYVVASVAIVSMITMYARSVLTSNKLVAYMFIFLVMLYTFMFVVIQSEGFALLIGCVALFVILGLVMVLSRNVDWYNTGNTIREPSLEN